MVRISGNTSIERMLTFANIEQANLSSPSCITIGNFDGLHRGHQALLQQLLAIAKSEAGRRGLPQPLQSGMVTFDPHPLAVLRPEHPHWLLTTPKERLELAGQQGLDFGVIQPFSTELATLSAVEFIGLLKRHLQLAVLVVGPDFALGRNRQGTVVDLQKLGETSDYTVHVIEPVDWQGISVRSSRIRTALNEGDVELTATLLGRAYGATGTVVEGDRRGRQIGIPTANLQTPNNKLLPKNGVYATKARLSIDGVEYTFDSATNLGTRPTVDGVEQRLEVHLLDFPPKSTEGSKDAETLPAILRDGNLYGQRLRVEFLARLRDEQRFDSLDALVAQIHADIAQARALFQNID